VHKKSNGIFCFQSHLIISGKEGTSVSRSRYINYLAHEDFPRDESSRIGKKVEKDHKGERI